jgi:hypothetical protein
MTGALCEKTDCRFSLFCLLGYRDRISQYDALGMYDATQWSLGFLVVRCNSCSRVALVWIDQRSSLHITADATELTGVEVLGALYHQDESDECIASPTGMRIPCTRCKRG